MLRNMTDTDATTAPTESDLAATIAGYFDCWNATDETARATAIERTWATNATSTDPMASVQGHAGIAEMMVGVGVMYPGHTFRQIGTLDAHHNLVRWGWEMIDPEGSRVIDGIDVALFDESGRLTNLAGFFGADMPA
jgi:hypothetical protein